MKRQPGKAALHSKLPEKAGQGTCTRVPRKNGYLVPRYPFSNSPLLYMTFFIPFFTSLDYVDIFHVLPQLLQLQIPFRSNPEMLFMGIIPAFQTCPSLLRKEDIPNHQGYLQIWFREKYLRPDLLLQDHKRSRKQCTPILP